MSAMRYRLAAGLMNFAGALSPPGRKEWLEAMKAEMPYVGDHDVLGFAAGCLFACVKERFRAMADLPPKAHHVLVAAMLLMAGFTARSSWRMTDEQPLNASVFASVAASYALAATWSVLKGAGGLIQAGSIFFLLNAGAAIWFLWRGTADVSASGLSLVAAVAFEGAAIWFSVLVICFLCGRSAVAER